MKKNVYEKLKKQIEHYADESGDMTRDQYRELLGFIQGISEPDFNQVAVAEEAFKRNKDVQEDFLCIDVACRNNHVRNRGTKRKVR